LTVTQNIARLNYLLRLYNLSLEEFLSIVNEGLKKPIDKEDLFAEEIRLNHLKRIDKVFNKGLHYYLDPKAPNQSKDASIFFRKNVFNSDLSLGAKKIVNHFEEFKISLSAIAKLANLKSNRFFQVYKISANPRTVAFEIRELIYPNFTIDLKEFLKALITKLAERNILVFEFVEYWNQKEKVNIDGFFLNPNVIVLKRQQSAFRREIFTLIHEFAHYLLNEEEVEILEYKNLAKRDLSAIENWCNDFSYYFLAGAFAEELDKVEIATPQNDYHHLYVKNISKNTHLSRIAIYTRLLYQNKISQSYYENVRIDLEEQYQRKLLEARKLKEQEKELGIKSRGSAPQPIKSPLLVSTIQTAFYEGVISEYEVCKTLEIKPERFSEYIQ